MFYGWKMGESEMDSNESGEFCLFGNTILIFWTYTWSSCFVSEVWPSFQWGLFAYTGWTPENLQRLFSAMKKSISDQDRNKSYNYGLKNVKWTTVAFPPFSASECKRKWMDIFRTVRFCFTLWFFFFQSGIGILISWSFRQNVHLW